MPNNQLKQTIYEMLTENTGRALMDSGDAYGRNWEKNQGKTLADFEREPSISFDMPTPWSSKEDEAANIEPSMDSSDILFCVSVFHVLTEYAGLELDALCDTYNAKFVPTKDWDGEYYGVSAKGQAWLDKRFNHKGEWNTYNGEQSLSQVLQGTMLQEKETEEWYCLLQIHGGCDVRGGYTDARLFKCSEGEYVNLNPDVSGEIDGIEVYSPAGVEALKRLDPETGMTLDIVSVKPDSVVKLYLPND